MAEYKVRDGFTVHDVAVDPIAAGEVIELTDEQFAAHAWQVELVDPAAIAKAMKAEAAAAKAAKAADDAV
jgi:hypothetical protein